jgi:hypothetical protein
MSLLNNSTNSHGSAPSRETVVPVVSVTLKQIAERLVPDERPCVCCFGGNHCGDLAPKYEIPAAVAAPSDTPKPERGPMVNEERKAAEERSVPWKTVVGNKRKAKLAFPPNSRVNTVDNAKSSGVGFRSWTSMELTKEEQVEENEHWAAKLRCKSVEHKPASDKFSAHNLEKQIEAARHQAAMDMLRKLEMDPSVGSSLPRQWVPTHFEPEEILAGECGYAHKCLDHCPVVPPSCGAGDGDMPAPSFGPYHLGFGPNANTVVQDGDMVDGKFVPLPGNRMIDNFGRRTLIPTMQTVQVKDLSFVGKYDDSTVHPSEYAEHRLGRFVDLGVTKPVPLPATLIDELAGYAFGKKRNLDTFDLVLKKGREHCRELDLNSTEHRLAIEHGPTEAWLGSIDQEKPLRVARGDYIGPGTTWRKNLDTFQLVKSNYFHHPTWGGSIRALPGVTEFSDAAAETWQDTRPDRQLISGLISEAKENVGSVIVAAAETVVSEVALKPGSRSRNAVVLVHGLGARVFARGYQLVLRLDRVDVDRHMDELAEDARNIGSAFVQWARGRFNRGQPQALGDHRNMASGVDHFFGQLEEPVRRNYLLSFDFNELP